MTNTCFKVMQKHSSEGHFITAVMDLVGVQTLTKTIKNYYKYAPEEANQLARRRQVEMPRLPQCSSFVDASCARGTEGISHHWETVQGIGLQAACHESYKFNSWRSHLPMTCFASYNQIIRI